MKLTDFVGFNAEKFLSSRNRWLEEKKKLEMMLVEMSELPSHNDESGVRGSDISDPTQRQASRIVEIKEKISEIDTLEEMYHKSIRSLSEESQFLVKVFFEPEMEQWKFVRAAERKYGCRRSRIYEKRREAIDKIAEYVERGL